MMAGKVEDDTAATSVSDLLSCPMCHVPYDTTEHEAKLLSCHHSCCMECLAQIAKGRPAFKCPTSDCQKKVRVPAEGLKSFKTNVYVTQMQSFISSSNISARNETEKNRKIPPKPKGKLRSQADPTQPSTEPPDVVKVKSRSGSRSSASGTCSKHFDQPLLFYCETCQTTICMNCTVLDHDKNNGHQITDVSTAVQVHHQILKTSAKRLEEAKTKCQEQLSLLRSQASHLEVSRVTAESQIKETFAQLVGKLEQRRDLLLEELRQIATDKKEELVTQGHNIQARLERVDRAATHIQNAIDDPNIHTAIALTEDTKTMSQIDRLHEVTPLQTKSNFIQYDYSCGLEKFVKTVSNLGAVTCEKALPAKIEVSFPKLTSSIKCAIKVCCQDGFCRGLANYPVSAQISDPCKDNIPCKLTHQDQGVYALFFRPQMPGKHVVSFQFLDKPMWQGEFDFLVESNNPVFTIAGDSSGGEGRLNRPTSVAVDSNGQIYIADIGNKCINIFSKGGKLVSRIKVGGQSSMTYDIAVNLATEELLCTKVTTDETGHMSANMVCVFGLNGEKKRQFSDPNLRKALFLAVNSKGQIIVTETVNNCMCIFSKEGKLLKKVGELGKKPSQFNFPSAVCTTSQNEIIVSDTNNHRIQIFSKSGKFIRMFGGEGRGKGHFVSPRGVAVDNDGHILVADSQNRIQVFSSEGHFISCIDSSGDKLNQPYNLTVKENGHVLVADFGNNSVKLYKYQ